MQRLVSEHAPIYWDYICIYFKNKRKALKEYSQHKQIQNLSISPFKFKPRIMLLG